jgi:hypothetical protein
VLLRPRIGCLQGGVFGFYLSSDPNNHRTGWSALILFRLCSKYPTKASPRKRNLLFGRVSFPSMVFELVFSTPASSQHEGRARGYWRGVHRRWNPSLQHS